MILAVLALVVSSFSIYLHFSRADFTSDTYRFSLDYPQGLDVKEEGDTIVLSDDGSEPIAIARSALANASTTYRNYDDFIHSVAAELCVGTSTTCTDVTRDDIYTNAYGVSGAIFYLKYSAREGNATTTREAGPFYAFALPNVPNAEYATLLIYPTHFAEEGALFDAGARAAQDLASSVRVDRD